MYAQVKTDYSEPVYTLSEAKKVPVYQHNRTKRKWKAERIYYLKQKLSGVAMLLIGIITPFLLEGDATFSLITVPLGVGLIITKQKVIGFRTEADDGKTF